MMKALRNARMRSLTLVSFALTSAMCTPKVCLELTTAEGALRKHAVKKVLPAFPSEALNENAAGVAVAQIHIDQKGTLTSVGILQAPHPSIAQATLAAVKQWEFKFFPNEGGTPECFNGKLTFYFVIEDGRGYVKNPKVFQND